jgi:multiple sugar transport system permease protein
MSARSGNAKTVAAYVVLIALLLFFLLPYAWMILTSFKTRLDIFAMPPKAAFAPTFANYREAFVEKNFLQNLRNSAVVCFFSVLLSLLIGLPSAYAFSRFRMKGDRFIFFYMLGTRFAPVIILALPLYFIMTRMRLLNTFLGIIIAHTAFNIVFVVWMMKSFFDSVPREIDEAAIVDGCSWFSVFARMGVPLTMNGIAATAVFCAINSWNEFLMALILTGGSTVTLPVAIPRLLTPQGTAWGQLAAVGSVVTLPVILFAFLVQKYMVRGMSAGSIK